MKDPFVNEKTNRMLCITSSSDRYMITESATRATQPFTLWKDNSGKWEKIKIADKQPQVAKLIPW